MYEQNSSGYPHINFNSFPLLGMCSAIKNSAPEEISDSPRLVPLTGADFDKEAENSRFFILLYSSLFAYGFCIDRK